MTTKQLSRLTPEQKRIKIAEACGAAWLESGGYKFLSFHPVIWPELEFNRAKGTEPIANLHYEGWSIPDYLNDLNAMREAQNTLTFSQQVDYASLLAGRRTSEGWISNEWALINATAAQRADAFLLTLP
jgi:hypothetical protein